ncbi:MAG: hypothetical protein ACUVXI_12725 [bacterium]
MIEIRANSKSAERMIEFLGEVRRGLFDTPALMRVLEEEGYRRMMQHRLIVGSQGALCNLTVNSVEKLIRSALDPSSIPDPRNRNLEIMRANYVRALSTEWERLNRLIASIRSLDWDSIARRASFFFSQNTPLVGNIYFLLDGSGEMYFQKGDLCIDLFAALDWSDPEKYLSYYVFNYIFRLLVRYWSGDFEGQSILVRAHRLCEAIKYQIIDHQMFRSVLSPSFQESLSSFTEGLEYLKDIEHLLMRILDDNLLAREWKKRMVLYFYGFRTNPIAHRMIGRLLLDELGPERVFRMDGFELILEYNARAGEINETGRKYCYRFNPNLMRRVESLAKEMALYGSNGH